MSTRCKFYTKIGEQYGWYLEWDPSGLVIQVAWLLDWSESVAEEEKPIANLWWKHIFESARKVAWMDRDSGNYYDLKMADWEPVELYYFDS